MLKQKEHANIANTPKTLTIFAKNGSCSADGSSLAIVSSSTADSSSKSSKSNTAPPHPGPERVSSSKLAGIVASRACMYSDVLNQSYTARSEMSKRLCSYMQLLVATAHNDTDSGWSSCSGSGGATLATSAEATAASCASSCGMAHKVEFWATTEKQAPCITSPFDVPQKQHSSWDRNLMDAGPPQHQANWLDLQLPQPVDTMFKAGGSIKIPPKGYVTTTMAGGHNHYI